MSQALPCVLLRFEGPSSWDLFRFCIESLTARKVAEIRWITDAVLPVEIEASENYVWNLIARRLGEGNDWYGLQILLHRYSHSRTLAAITGHPSLASDESLLRLTHCALAIYADALGMPSRPVNRSHRVRLGTSLSLPDANWSWRGLAHISDELLQLVAACYICLHLFAGYPQISMDILEPAEALDGADTILTLSLTMNGDLPIRSVEQSLRAMRGKENLVSRGTTLNSLGIIVGRTAGSADSEIQIGDLRVSVEERQRVAPWEVKLALPPVGSCEPPRIEGTAPLDTAATLLRHVYDSLTSVPDIPISAVTISRETHDVSTFSIATRS
jgi:hypothetical protein